MVGAYALVLIGHPPWPVVVVATIAVAIVFALAMERVAFRPLRGANPATLLDRLVRRQLRAAEPRDPDRGVGAAGDERLDAGCPSPSQIGSVSIPKLDVVTVGVTLVLLVALGLFLNARGWASRCARRPRTSGWRASSASRRTGHRDGVRDQRPAGRHRRVPARRADRRGRARHRHQPRPLRLRRDGARGHGQPARRRARRLRARRDLRRAPGLSPARAALLPRRLRFRAP